MGGQSRTRFEVGLAVLLTRQVTGTEDRYTEPLLKRVVATAQAVERRGDAWLGVD